MITMRSRHRIVPLLLVIALFAAGCGDDAVTPADHATTAEVRGEIGAGAGFELTFPFGNDRSGLTRGPFILRGSNLHYDEAAGALTVDLTLTHRGDRAFPEPVGLTFLRLFPDGVTVQDPDNGINGDGAAIVFQFEKDDAMWTPGETSLPRTVHFAAERGVAVGFIARVDVSMPPAGGGVISGRVWHDANQDGVMDEGEAGLAGVPVVLSSSNATRAANVAMWRTRTNERGGYRFEGLRPGTYRVSKAPVTGLEPTTPTEIVVLLAETEDGVSSFADAHFGCVRRDVEPPALQVGLYIEASGHYETDPHRVSARQVIVRLCNTDEPVLNDGDDENRPGCRRVRLRGPVTAIAFEGGSILLMGTELLGNVSVAPGDRIDARAHWTDDRALAIDAVDKWDGDHEEVRGRIDRIEIGNYTTRLHVAGTVIVVTPQTVIRRP
jgi:hypothetical protein